MEKKRPNRMIKDSGDSVERVEAPPKKEEEENGYPCKFCGKPTRIVETFPVFRTVQWPEKVVRRRKRQCLACQRRFFTEEINIGAENGPKVDI